MEPEIAGDPPAGKDRSGNAFERMPELPSVRKRWTVRRKAAVIEAVRRGRLSLDQVCRIYTLSLEEFLAWERDMDRYGVPGLRVTRYQIYRQTETRGRAAKDGPPRQTDRTTRLVHAGPRRNSGHLATAPVRC